MAQFRTEDFAAPHKYGEGGGAPDDFDTFHMEAPVKMGGPGATATAPPANPVPTPHGGNIPMHAAPSYGSLAPMKQGLVIADLVLRSLAALALIIGLAVLAAASQTAALSDGLTVVDRTTVTFSVSPNTKYGLSACIIGAVYLIYQVVSTCFRLFTKKPLLPGNISTIVAYVGDQLILILLLSGGAAVAAFLKDIHDQGYCMSSLFPTFCNQVAGATSMLFIAFALVLASFQITAYSFYKNRI